MEALKKKIRKIHIPVVKIIVTDLHRQRDKWYIASKATTQSDCQRKITHLLDIQEKPPCRREKLNESIDFFNHAHLV